jgi:serine/threonine protein kinase
MHDGFLSNILVRMDDYEDADTIGSGSFGDVYLVTHRATGELLACKALRYFANPAQQKDFHREIEAMMRCDHRCVARVRGFTFWEMRIGTGELVVLPSIFMDYFAKGSLAGYLVPRRGRRAGWSGTARSKVIFGVASGMSHLHGRGIIHRDLKPANILLNDSLEPSIGDFGISRIVERLIASRAGSPLFMAPETLDGRREVTNKCDVYSFAITVFQMFGGREELVDGLTPSNPSFEGKIVDGCRFGKPKAMPKAMWQLVTECWDQDPARRPSFKSIVSRLLAAFDWCFDGADVTEVRRYAQTVCHTDGSNEKSRVLLSQFPIDLSEYEVTSAFGTGKVQLVTHRTTGEKFTKRVLSGDIATMAMFYKELELHANIKHPTIAAIHGFAFGEDGKPVILTEFAEVGKVQGRKLTPTNQSKVILGTAVALSVIHSNDMVYDGLRPGNVLLNGDYEPIISDLFQSKDSSIIPLYRAPELTNDGGRPIDRPKCDVYTFAVFVHQMITHESQDRPRLSPMPSGTC